MQTQQQVALPLCPHLADPRLVAMQKILELRHARTLGGGADDGMHQPARIIYADMRLHAKVPLIALFRLGHLRIAFAVSALG